MTGSLFINEPNYKNSNRSFNRSIERIEDDKLSSFGYKTEKTGFTIGTSYEQYDDIFFSPKLNNYYEKITTNSKVSAQSVNKMEIILIFWLITELL